MESLRTRISAFLQRQPPPVAPNISFVEQQEKAEDGYTRSLVKYAAPDGDVIEAFLFRPSGGEARAAVLVLHQHNSQWTLGKSEIAGLAGDPLQAFGPALARQGVVVLAPDAVGFE